MSLSAHSSSGATLAFIWNLLFSQSYYYLLVNDSETEPKVTLSQCLLQEN